MAQRGSEGQGTSKVPPTAEEQNKLRKAKKDAQRAHRGKSRDMQQTAEIEPDMTPFGIVPQQHSGGFRWLPTNRPISPVEIAAANKRQRDERAARRRQELASQAQIAESHEWIISLPEGSPEKTYAQGILMSFPVAVTIGDEKQTDAAIKLALSVLARLEGLTANARLAGERCARRALKDAFMELHPQPKKVLVGAGV